MSKIGDIKTRLHIVLTRDEQPNPGSPLDVDEIAEMLMVLVKEHEKLERRLETAECALRYKGML